MSRNAMLAVIAGVAVLVGVPLAIAVLGGDDEPARSAPGAVPAPQAVEPEDRGAGQSPPAPDAQRGRGGRRADRGKGRGGPPPHAKAFDDTMEGVGYPNAITRSGRRAVQAVERAAGPEVEAGQQTVIAADCRGGVCSIRYRSGPRGTGQIQDGAAQIMRTLFADAGVRKVVLYVHHKTVGRKKEERPAFIVVSCTRRPGVVWSRLTPRQLANRCEVTDQAGGRLRNNVRRGQLSVDGASRGAKVPQGQGGGVSGERAPETVKGTAEAERAARERR